MSKHGNIFVYGGQADSGEHTIINNEDYKLKINKSWIKDTEQWHIKFSSQSIYETRFEIFLTKDELQELRRVL